MKTHDVQSISIKIPAKMAFEYVSKPKNLPEWTNAFKRADDNSADLVTPNGEIPIQLETIQNSDHGTIDWKMTFPDGSIGMAYSRVTPEGVDACIYSFLLMAPPVPLELLEGALSEQSVVLKGELADLKSRLEK